MPQSEAESSPRAIMWLEFRLLSQGGVTYPLEAADRLPASGWQTVATLAGKGGEIVFGPFPTTQPARAFRVQAEWLCLSDRQPRRCAWLFAELQRMA